MKESVQWEGFGKTSNPVRIMQSEDGIKHNKQKGTNLTTSSARGHDSPYSARPGHSTTLKPS